MDHAQLRLIEPVTIREWRTSCPHLGANLAEQIDSPLLMPEDYKTGGLVAALARASCPSHPDSLHLPVPPRFNCIVTTMLCFTGVLPECMECILTRFTCFPSFVSAAKNGP